MHYFYTFSFFEFQKMLQEKSSRQGESKQYCTLGVIGVEGVRKLRSIISREMMTWSVRVGAKFDKTRAKSPNAPPLIYNEGVPSSSHKFILPYTAQVVFI